MIRVYTDGACRGNPGPGGWGWASGPDDYASGAEVHTTNQRMEVTAVIEALRDHPAGEIEIVSDSNYVVKCFQDRWYLGWRRRGWKNTAGKPVANRDLWEVLIPLALESGRPVLFTWVKGHSGEQMNDFVDALATAAADSQLASHS
ncbi:MAG TPA: ribonuclease H [Acidimicrobiales bacterium]|jgi:ribonuclease HI